MARVWGEDRAVGTSRGPWVALETEQTQLPALRVPSGAEQPSGQTGSLREHGRCGGNSSAHYGPQAKSCFGVACKLRTGVCF